MATRVQSPSSINTFKQCERKYYYQYIKKLPTSQSIHLVRGNIVHSVLEDFYDLDVSLLTKDTAPIKFRQELQRLLLHHWIGYGEKLNKLGLEQDKIKFYFEESMMMVLNWGNYFVKDFNLAINGNDKTVPQVFKELTPIRELQYKSEKFQVRGFIDAIAHIGNEVHIIDYKTNSSSELKESIRRQLSIYCLMYEEKHGVLPQKVGAFFVRDTLKMIPVTREMVQDAKVVIEGIHAHTGMTEAVVDYKRNITPLCKWRTGQCDFFEICKPHG